MTARGDTMTGQSSRTRVFPETAITPQKFTYVREAKETMTVTTQENGGRRFTSAKCTFVTHGLSIRSTSENFNGRDIYIII
jgi:hypothetical protein